jgi:protein-tyrosine phosphatase
VPWDEIIPGLFMGGHFYRAPSGEVLPVVVRDEFDLVVSLYRRDGHGPAAGIVDHVREMPDAALTAAQLADVCELADITAAAARDGRKVLVRCHSGFNRSGLVVAQALGHLGYGADDAIFLVRYRRSKRALNNDLFVDYLTTGLDVAALLAGLAAPD